MVSGSVDGGERSSRRRLADVELLLMQRLVETPDALAAHDEAALRWAFSFARLSKVDVDDGGRSDVIDITTASDVYRRELARILDEAMPLGRITDDGLAQIARAVRPLVRDERDRVLQLFGARLSATSLDRATRVRPLALALAGGGGTAYVYTGALAVMEEAGLIPAAVAGTSMGAILGAFRCRTRTFALKNVRSLISRVTWRRVFRAFETQARFGFPATLKLYLREVIGPEFEVDGRFLRLADMEIPFRVCIAGIAQPESPEEEQAYAHLLDDAVRDVRRFRGRATAIARALSEFARRPVKAIYLGGDDLTAEFDVLDAIGFSSAVPGVIHYDILRDDPRMVALAEAVCQREKVYRFVDGGLVDNLPAGEASHAVQTSAKPGAGRDPFVLALDAFAPRLTGRNMLFLPLMRLAAENARRGRSLAHLTIQYRNVLSPLTLVPTPHEFRRALENGRVETTPHLAVVRKMVGPIPDPPGIVHARDGA